MLTAIFFLVFVSLLELSTSRQCKWKGLVNQRDESPEVYWINMDKSLERQDNMRKHLGEVGLKNQRIRGITPKQIYIPDDIQSTWQTAWCKTNSDWIPPPRWELNTTSTLWQYSSVALSLCGRKKKNTPKELGCTTSHLLAMRAAIYSNSKSRYALVFEDDVHVPFDIDFLALVQSAPPDFGILQLFNSNQGSMESTWKMYLKDNSKLWVKRHPMKFFDFWSTCAYLIDKQVMKPIIDAVAYEHNGWMNFKVVAGINNPCVPKDCCAAGTDNFELKPPCVWAPRGFQADSYLYATTTTYMLTIPIISNGLGGNQSTFHQDHVESVHRGAFRRQREYINELLSGRVAPPSFLAPACSPVDVVEI